MNLLEVLQTTPEFRHLRGRRHELGFVLLLVISGGICGYWGYRPVAEFAVRYGRDICRELGLEQPRQMPSYSTFRRIMVQLDYVAFATVFNEWASTYVAIDPGEWLAVDGKGIRSSVTAYNQAAQNFMMLVGVFSHRRGFVMHSLPMENKHGSELHTVQSIIETLDLKGAVVTADALHTKKNSPGDCGSSSPLSVVRQRQPTETLYRLTGVS